MLMEGDKKWNRVWGYNELAQEYFPDIKKESATIQFSRWIRIATELQTQLTASGWKPGRKILSPKQVLCIVGHLGEPGE